MRFLLLLLLALLPFASSIAQSSTPSSVTELQAQYRLLLDLQATDQISATTFDSRAAQLQQIAEERFNLSLEGLAIEQAVTAQRVNWLASALYLAAALLVFLLLGPLLRKLWKPLRALFRTIWHLDIIRQLYRGLVQLAKLLWEPLSYVILIACLWVYPNEWLLLLASFALGSLISYSVYSRRKQAAVLSGESIDQEHIDYYQEQQRYNQRAGTLSSWLVTLVWAGLAYYFDHAWVGFMAVAAFISSMGFAMVLWPGAIGIGFKRYDKVFVLRLTGIMLVLTVLAWLIFYTEYIPFLSALRQPLRVYEVGLLSLVPLVYFLGLGYTAFFVYGRKTAVYQQILARIFAFSMGYLTVALGLLYGIGSLFWIGLFFMTWFAVDLYFELVFRKIDVVWSGLVLAGLLGGAGYWLKNNLSTVLEFAVGLGW